MKPLPKLAMKAAWDQERGAHSPNHRIQHIVYHTHTHTHTHAYMHILLSYILKMNLGPCVLLEADTDGRREP